MFFLSFLSFGAVAQDSVVTVRVGDVATVEMVYVRGGRFTMGSNEGKGARDRYDYTGPEHTVSVDGFYIGRYEVTQGLWSAVMGENPSRWRGDEALPVESVTWTEAQEFCMLLSQLTGKRFRLPTEAEWEYAARGGEDYAFAGCDRRGLDDCAWYCVNSEGRTHVVGSRGANAYGLYDMSGNVAEWCQDWVEEYTEAEQTNPRGPREGENRVLRGGHYGSTSAACTVYDRGWYLPTGKYEFYGLRVVMEE